MWTKLHPFSLSYYDYDSPILYLSLTDRHTNRHAKNKDENLF
jgi:hypothetical protein